MTQEQVKNRSSPALTLFQPVGYLFPCFIFLGAIFAWFVSGSATRYVAPSKSDISNLLGAFFVVLGFWFPCLASIVSAWIVGRCYLNKVWIHVDQDGITLTECFRWNVYFYDWREFEKFSVNVGIKGEKTCLGEFTAHHPEVKRHHCDGTPPKKVGLHIGINYGLTTTAALVDLLNTRLAESRNKAI